MPYIAIKTLFKDEETKKRAVEKINEVMLETWGCPQEAITISVEEFSSDDFGKGVRDSEILPKKDKMMIFDGKKLF